MYFLRISLELETGDGVRKWMDGWLHGIKIWGIGPFKIPSLNASVCWSALLKNIFPLSWTTTIVFMYSVYCFLICGSQEEHWYQLLGDAN